MGWGNGIGIGWPNASAYSTPPVPTNVYYQIVNWCLGEEVPFGYTTQLVDSNIYHTGDYVYSTNFETGLLLGPSQLVPGLGEATIIGPSYPYCPPLLESYYIYDCVAQEYYTTGYYDQGTLVVGDRVHTQGDNYGFVESIQIAQEGNTDSYPFPIGYVDYRCNDNDIGLYIQFEENGDGDWWINLYGQNYSNELDVNTDVNALTVNISYYALLNREPEDPVITRSGNTQINVLEYHIPVSTTVLLGSIFAFSAPVDYGIYYDESYITSISLSNTALGPYDTGWDLPNKYVTNYGNVWTFYWTFP